MAIGRAMTELAVGIAILAKAPLPGFAKTRLIPALGAEGAAALQARLITHTVDAALAAGVGPVMLWGAPDATHPVFAAAAASGVAGLRTQPAGDLGVRLHAACAAVPGQATLLIGTDCPALDVADLRAAAGALRSGRDAVLVPAEDGGYALIGLAAPRPEPFSRIAWGRDSVLATTRARLAAAGLSWIELPTRWDVDRPGDLPRLRAAFPALLADDQARPDR